MLIYQTTILWRDSFCSNSCLCHDINTEYSHNCRNIHCAERLLMKNIIILLKTQYGNSEKLLSYAEVLCFIIIFNSFCTFCIYLFVYFNGILGQDLENRKARLAHLLLLDIGYPLCVLR